MSGSFVVLEGGAGTGKSTLLDAVAETVSEEGISVKTVPEFADAAIGEFVARELDEGDRQRFRERACSLAAGTLANCCYQAETVVTDALETHDVVLTERYLDSVAVYDLPLVEERSADAFPADVTGISEALPVASDLTVLLTMDRETRRERFRTHRPELLDGGSVPERFSARQARFRERLAGRDDAVVLENDGRIADAAERIGEEIRQRTQ